MGGKWSRAKRARKMKRAYLKRYSLPSNNYRVDGGALEMLGYHQRLNSTAKGEEEPGNVYFDQVWKKGEMERLWQSHRLQGIDRFNRVLLQDTGLKKIWLFFSGKEYVLVRVLKRPLAAMRSITYGSRERAMTAWRTEQIVWADALQLPE